MLSEIEVFVEREDCLDRESLEDTNSPPIPTTKAAGGKVTERTPKADAA
jgi:hypothetical protein